MVKAEQGEDSLTALLQAPGELAVEDGVPAGARHGEHVEGEEGEVVVGPAQERHLGTQGQHSGQTPPAPPRGPPSG